MNNYIHFYRLTYYYFITLWLNILKTQTQRHCRMLSYSCLSLIHRHLHHLHHHHHHHHHHLFLENLQLQYATVHRI